MSKLNARFAGYGLESEEEVLVEELPQVEEEVVEANFDEAVSDVAETEDNIEEMTEVAESLEAICLGLEAAITHDGALNRQAAAFALQSVDLQLGRLGLEALPVSMEDFEEPVLAEGEAEVVEEAAVAEGETEVPVEGEVSEDNLTSVEPDAEPVTESEEAGPTETAVAASLESVAKVKEIIAKIWEAVVNAYKKLVEFVKNLWAAVTSRAVRLKNRAEKVKAAATGAKETGKGEKSVKVGGLLKKVHIGGKMPTAAALEAIIAKITKSVYVDYPQDVVKVVAGYTKAGKGDVASLEALAMSVLAVDVPVPSICSKKESSEELDTYISDELPGGKVLSYSFDAPGYLKKKLKIGGKYSYVLSDANAKVTLDKEGTITTPSLTDVVKYADSVIACADAILAYNKVSANISKNKDSFFKLVQTRIDVLRKKEGPDAVKIAQAYGRLITNLNSQVDGLSTKVSPLMITMSDALLNICKLTLKDKGVTVEAAAAAEATA